MRDVECSGAAPRGKATSRAATLALAVVSALAVSTPARAGADEPAVDPTADPVWAPLPAEVLARAASPDFETREGAVGSLQVLATPAAYQLVLVMLQRDLDPRVRATAAVALGASRDPDFEPALAYAAAADPAPSVRAAAAASRAAVAPFAKRPKVAAAFSVLCPGCGYFYLGRPDRAIRFLGVAAELFAAGLVVTETSPLVRDGTTTRHDDGRAAPLLIAFQNLWFYGVYASYRDARLARADHGARFPVAKEGLGELLVAPFNPHVLKSPWVWAGLPAMLGAALGASYLISRATSNRAAVTLRTLGDGNGVQFFGSHYSTGPGVALGSAYNTTLFLPVGVGEESLFRGVVQAGLMETSLGLWGGWAVGSAIFGAAHTINFIGKENGAQTAALAVPYLMVTGSYLGFVYIHSNFSLLQGVALHFWYDFLLSTIDFIVEPDSQPFVASFAIPF